MNRRRVGTSLYAGVLFTVLGAIAWASGQPFISPSLGPSAFILAFERRGERTRTYRVVGSHLIGAVASWLAYTLFAAGVSLTVTPPPLSAGGTGPALSGILPIVLTSWAMIATDLVHAPAGATTLIVSLGLLSTPVQVAIIVASVVILVEFHVGVPGLQAARRRTPPAVSGERWSLVRTRRGGSTVVSRTDRCPDR